jgi:hypothetical protein
MEQDTMASNNHPDQRAAAERESPKDQRSSVPPSAPRVPQILHDGLELPRSNHC